MIESYDSVVEARHGCESAMPGFISHQPTIENLEPMYAIQNKNKLILTELGEYDSCPNIHDIKWYQWFLEAEESAVGTGNTVVGAVPLMESLMLMKDLDLDRLREELVKEKEAYDLAVKLLKQEEKEVSLLKLKLDMPCQGNNDNRLLDK